MYEKKYLTSKAVLIYLFCSIITPADLHAEMSTLYSKSGFSSASSLAHDSNLNIPFFSLDKRPPEETDLPENHEDLEPPDQDGFLGRYTVLAEDAVYFLPTGLIVLAVVYMMPESVSNWNTDEITLDHAGQDWWENVTHWEWDSDEDWINYIGHPYFGSRYYVYARHYGYSQIESFWFSFAASAFYEIGLEAWAEPVSIQDIIFTPLLGWGVAEFLLLPLENMIRRNNNEVLQSKILGAISLFLIDPFGHIVLPMKRWVRDNGWFKSEELQLLPMLPERPYYETDNGGQASVSKSCYGLFLTVKF